MKLRVNIILLLLVFHFNIYCQTWDMIRKDYDNGINCLQNNNYHLADSLFTSYLNKKSMGTIALALNKTISLNDIYFNLAVAKLGLNDTVAFCDKMHTASLSNDSEAFREYCRICVNSVDSIFYDKSFKITAIDKAKYKKLQYFDKYYNHLKGIILDLEYINKSKLHYTDFDNIVGTYYVNATDTIFTLLMGENIPKFSKWNKSYYDFVETSLIYPENKALAYSIYNEKILYVEYKVILSYEGKIEKAELVKFYPKVLDQKYKDEALNFIQKAAPFVIPGKVFGKKVKTELTFPVKFTLKTDD